MIKKIQKATALVGALGMCMAMASCGAPSSASVASAGTADNAAASSTESKAATGDKSSFTVWANGSDNVKIQFEKQIEQFNKTNDQYEAKLEFITSGTGAQGLSDRLIAAQKAGETNTNYDLIEMSDSEMANYTAQVGDDMFQPYDKSLVPNIANCKYQVSVKADCFVPYRGTTVLLAYNSETVPTPPTTTEELYQWIKDNPTRFAYNTPSSGGAGSSFVVTSVYNFLDESALTSTDEANMDKWSQGFDLLKELHPYMYKSSGKVVYPNKNQGTLDLLANKEIDMCPAWADMVISQKTQGTMPESIQLTQIDPAFTGQLVGFAVPKMASNPEGAQAFMNYMLTPEAQNIALESMAALPVIDFAQLDQNLISTISSLDIKNFRSSSIGPLGTKMNEKWDAEIATLG